MPKIYVEKRGFVITNDLQEIDMLLAEGGRVVVKNREIDQPIDDLVADPIPVQPEQWEEVTQAEEVKPEPKPVNKFKSKLK